ncbi:MULTISPECIES: hypothetical protein [Trichocoleus]|uniref:Uncharacterized protein n=1 Tax=Trichocoleus desertorum GB2-A4 TaxID=2933944 RepID=A0ABV0JGT5_9CYAN|nr:hypothetical protein [Trichocoleus sp. FACHB-46]MBD1865654.1 hypothetical protein [Trichocoleus sp. FACHB-46]
MHLICRGHIYPYIPTVPQPYVKPHALNWRFQSPEETYETGFVPQPYVKPRALNWRYQLAAGL